MGLFKADFYRFFTIGFAVGALLTVVTVEGNMGSDLVNSVVPAAEAQSTQ